MVRRWTKSIPLRCLAQTLVVYGLLLVLAGGCGGGGGNRVQGESPIRPIAPPGEETVRTLFPLTQGLRRTYTTSHNARMTVDGRVYEKTETGTATSTIAGTQGAPFPVETVIDEWHEREQWTAKENGTQREGTSESWVRHFWTNQGGEVRGWGQQSRSGADWGDIVRYDPPLLLLKAGETSWDAGSVLFSVDLPIPGRNIKVIIAPRGSARLRGQQSVTVPAGTFNCYRLEAELRDLRVITHSPGVEVTRCQGSLLVTIWLASGRGQVKLDLQASVSLEVRDLASGNIIRVSLTSSSTESLRE
ncbi:MAG: hypothetical protein NZ959_11060 [Armatimonadetes bacterium]|nr:hypothetical protein [Armatimonadota bacterium]MDW8120686.1 hypothetical protein [Armatimonadota bacterium]